MHGDNACIPSARLFVTMIAAKAEHKNSEKPRQHPFTAL
jgi:hypothetical protein